MGCDHNQLFPGDADTCEIFPDQNSEKRFNECSAETVADIVGNIVGKPMSAGFSFAAAKFLIGKKPSAYPISLLAAMDSAVAYGCLPLLEADFDAITTSSEYEADINHYTLEDRNTAKWYAQKAVQWLYSFDEVIAHIEKTKTGVALGMKWYASFNVPPPDGELPEPGGNYSLHAVAVYEVSPDKSMIKVKPWLGSNFGNHGYVWLNRFTYQKVMQEAYGFDPEGIRIIYLLGLAARRLPYLTSFLPSIISNLQKPMPELQWDTPKQAYHSVRVLCDNAGLPLTKTVFVPGVGWFMPKDIICATIFQESRFSNKAKNENPNSTDWGICQVNDKAQIGPGKRYPSVQYVLNHPEQPVKWMIDEWESKNRLQPWYGYTQGAYKQWLLPSSPMWALKGD